LLLERDVRGVELTVGTARGPQGLDQLLGSGVAVLQRGPTFSLSSQSLTAGAVLVQQLDCGHVLPVSASPIRQLLDVGVDLSQRLQVPLLLRDELGLVRGRAPPGLPGLYAIFRQPANLISHRSSQARMTARPSASEVRGYEALGVQNESRHPTGNSLPSLGVASAIQHVGEPL